MVKTWQSAQISYIQVHCVNLNPFSPNTGKYRPEKTLYLDTIHKSRRMQTEGYKYCKQLPFDKRSRLFTRAFSYL